MKTAIIDIDGTLADCRHRLHHVLPGQKRDWDAFFSKMDDDGLIDPVASVVRSMADQYKIVLSLEHYRQHLRALFSGSQAVIGSRSRAMNIAASIGWFRTFRRWRYMRT